MGEMERATGHPVTGEIDRLLDGNSPRVAPMGDRDPRPTRRLAVVTCMDARIAVLDVLGLHPGEAHVIRNAGARVTTDVQRSLALSTHLMGVERVAVVQHTGCGLAGATEEELRTRVGVDLDFHPIEDHAAALAADVDVLATTPYLGLLVEIAGLVYDLSTGRIHEITRWNRPAPRRGPQTSSFPQ